jgi:hypothetical protein
VSSFETHKQSWVKVNTPVDTGISEIVELLNRVPHLQTIASCQGWQGRAGAYVYFYYGDWRQISEFAFGRVAPALRGIEGAEISVEVFNDSDPMGKLSFRAEVTRPLASALKTVFNHRRLRYSCGKARRGPRS